MALNNIIERCQKWKSEMNEVFQGTLESEYWPLWLSAPKELLIIFVMISCILMTGKEVSNLEVSESNAKPENSLLAFYLVFSVIFNCAIFVNTLVYDNSKTIWVTIPQWILQKLKISEEWVLSISLLISLFKCSDQ